MDSLKKYFDRDMMLTNHICEDLSYTIFKELDFSLSREKISFYRSDFRGSHFENIVFQGNIFDIADFINCTFINVEFVNCDLGEAEFKNCYFSKCRFTSNIYGDLCIHDSFLSKCVFKNEIFRMTCINCQFEDSEIIDCIFDQCTTDKISFSNCTIINCDMSTMHAENYKITGGSFLDTFWGSCFIGSYLIKKVDLKLIKFKYRGKEVKLSDDYFPKFFQKLKAEGRWFEYLNCLVLSHTEINAFIAELQLALEMICKESNRQVRQYNLSNIFDMLSFYAFSDDINVYNTLCIYQYITSFDWEKFYSSEIILLNSLLFNYNEKINRLNIDTQNFDIPLNVQCELVIHYSSSDHSAAIKDASYLLNAVNEKILNNIYPPNSFEILSIKDGSTILTISTYLLLALFSSKIIRMIHGDICKMRVDNRITKRSLHLLDNTTSLSALSKAKASICISDDEKLQTSVKKLYGEFNKSSIIEAILNFLIN